MSAKTALVAGATGLVGQELLSLLIGSAQYEHIKVVTRRPLHIESSKVTELVVDFNQLDKHKESMSADVYFCCLGTTMKKAGSKEKFYEVDFEYTNQLAVIARSMGAAQFNVISAMGANSNSAFFYNHVKGEVEEALQMMNFSSLHIFRPSLLTGDRGESRLAERMAIVLSKVVNPLLMGQLKKYRSIPASVVAKAMYNISVEPRTGTFVFESDQITEIAAS